MQSYAELLTLILFHVSNLFSNVTSGAILGLTQIGHWISHIKFKFNFGYFSVYFNVNSVKTTNNLIHEKFMVNS